MILIGGSSCNTSGSDDDITMRVGWQGHKVCGENFWENIECQKVIKISFDIDGVKVYSIKESNYTDLLRRCWDGRPWKKDSWRNDSWRKWSGFQGCNGSLRGPNSNYSFLSRLEKRNRLKFNSSRICEEAVAFPARKYTAYITEKKARIFSFGTHIYQTKFVNNRPADSGKPYAYNNTKTEVMEWSRVIC